MTKKLVLAGAVLLLVAAVVLAADAITGKWVYEQQGRGGGNPVQVTLDLKASGATLSGTITQPMGGRGMGGGGAPAAPQPVQISNGKVDGNNISFDVVREFNGNSMTTNYKGTVSGGDMKLTITRTGMDGTPTSTDVVAKRSTT
jgi:hypothetical protein